MTPARSIARSSLRRLRSEIRSSIADINPECGIASKQFETSDSAIHRLPLHASSIKTWRASCVERRGRNPNEHSSMSASKIGSITILVAAWTTRSRIAGIDSGRRSVGLPGFGMNTRRAGSGRHRPSFRSAASSSSSRSTPYSSTSAMVCRSMPAAPRLARTSSHARSRTSLR
jgi:hypothetical protein